METFQALVSNGYIYSVINIVLVTQRVSVEVRGELSTKPRLVRSTPHIWKEWINHIKISRNHSTVIKKTF
jgi:hypothetical protein